MQISELIDQNCQTAGPIPLFGPGDRVAFFGDSIVHYGTWWQYVWCHYINRFSQNPPFFINAGFSGDTATGALNRLERDVFNQNADAVVMMFGMNDIQRDFYTVANAPEDQAARKQALDTYEKSMEEILHRVLEKHLHCIVLTPSPYDQTLVHNAAAGVNPGCNDGLAVVSQMLFQLAGKYGCNVIDLHGSMTRLNAELQQNDPSATIIGLDRVHPGEEGSQIMADLFLRAQGDTFCSARDLKYVEAVNRYVELERNLRNILWMEDQVLSSLGMDPADIDSARIFFRTMYHPDNNADTNRVKSYLDWKGREAEVQKNMNEVWGYISTNNKTI